MKVWFNTEVSDDGRHSVGHTKSYVKVLVPLDGSLPGKSRWVDVHSCQRFHIEGVVSADQTSHSLDVQGIPQHVSTISTTAADVHDNSSPTASVQVAAPVIDESAALSTNKSTILEGTKMKNKLPAADNTTSTTEASCDKENDRIKVTDMDKFRLWTTKREMGNFTKHNTYFYAGAVGMIALVSIIIARSTFTRKF
jgi:hypothetical protein